VKQKFCASNWLITEINDLYIAINIVTLAKRRLQLPDDGLCKPKHVGANIIVSNVSTV